jgi:predicted nucleic acid-binding protein
MDVFLGYSFDEVDMSPAVCRSTFTITSKYQVSFCDAVYHAVALLHKGVLITADEIYHRRVAVIGRIDLLRNYRTYSS